MASSSPTAVAVVLPLKTYHCIKKGTSSSTTSQSTRDPANLVGSQVREAEAVDLELGEATSDKLLLDGDTGSGDHGKTAVVELLVAVVLLL